ncbi:putative protein N(5)-glutamine methyltransferase [Prauserella cavernicola]|uniref:peptide chain release factor N(5)-glutamine methyltransferase n=1 Tax=Prauserella cavernicola TaxID=2800127 RepID=A0A934QND2_9PSEU|nr:putative protein N(5)-glutamine methyltransferase [Prauserella cavernicola]MBK1783092.1 putative protein N(5)-glutamine methyltransferase [Prauserella cavernicola]
MSAFPEYSYADVVSALRAAGCVFAEDEARLLTDAASTAGELATLVRRRADGEPLEHVVGWAEFLGRRIVLEPGVFVPRRRTEFLARQAIALTRPGAVVLDLCCGSGAVGAVVADAVSPVTLVASDVDPAAVRCARRNLPAGASVYSGDLFAPLPSPLRSMIDVLVANVPYVPARAVDFLPTEAREHEPRVALDGGADGLDVLRRVAREAPDWLAPGGSLLIETSDDQASLAVDAFAAAGLESKVLTCDDTSVVVGQRPSTSR